MRLFSNKQRFSAVKVKSNFQKYSRAEEICQSRETLTYRYRMKSLRRFPSRSLLLFNLLFPPLLLLPLQHQTELDLLLLNLLLDLLLLILVHHPGKDLSQPGDLLEQIDLA